MAIKHNPQAPLLITEAIENMEPFAQEICRKLRHILNVRFPELTEDWKWGPNYYLEGMVCGFWGFKKHASLVFFNGATLKDPAGVLEYNSSTKNNRHMRFSSVKDVQEKIIVAYVKEAISINKSGVKKVRPADQEKVIELHPEFKRALSKAGLLRLFNAMTYYKRKEMNMWISDAKRDETRLNRIEKSLLMIREGKSVMDKYR
jgi:uncharacterized protein YdeI (YjbR/CyaY-like superfamily)